MDGERLSELRKDKGLTQKDLAKILSVSENSISLLWKKHHYTRWWYENKKSKIF